MGLFLEMQPIQRQFGGEEVKSLVVGRRRLCMERRETLDCTCG